jgi:hypothetical protein
VKLPLKSDAMLRGGEKGAKMCWNFAPENLERLEGGVLDAANLLGSGQKYDGQAWEANDRSQKKIYDEALHHLQIHESARAEVCDVGDGCP